MADDEIQNVPTVQESGDTPSDAPTGASIDAPHDAPPAKKAAAKKAASKKTATKKAATKKAAAKQAAPVGTDVSETDAAETEAKPAKKSAAKKATAKKTAATSTKKAAKAAAPAVETEAPEASEPEAPGSGTMPLFQVPEKTAPAKRTRTRPTKKAAPAPVEPAVEEPASEEDEETTDEATDDSATEAPAETPQSDDGSDDDSDDDSDSDGGPRRRRRRGGRRRRRTGSGEGGDEASSDDESGDAAGDGDAQASAAAEPGTSDQSDDAEGAGTSTRRRRKRRREGEDGGGNDDSGVTTTTRVRRTRSPEDEITSIQGSTRLEAKKQRRRDGREAGRRRAPIVSEAEFLARRESVERVMVVRQREELTQIGVLEDKVLVEHYVARESQTSLIGNIYLGRVQNVLPSMEAAFIDIGKGRNAVIYAGEVNWQQLGHKDGQPRKIESVLSSGQTILVQVSKDPIGHKGARLTSQISLAGRFLVYVPDGTTSGISRKLPDVERNRLKTLLKEVVPSTAGVIVRTAAEGASEEELTQDVERLKARWEEIEAKTKGKGGNPQLLHGEPDLTLKVVRDLFTEDFAKLVIQGDDVYDLVSGYVTDMAPDLHERLEKYDAAEHNAVDLFSAYRIDEQIAKALDRKVFLPSGGSLVIDRTEAMTVVDVNTGKFTGSGGNLEETVTKNNLEAAEEVVRQLRLRDIGGIIVVDFIDMVLEANRDLVLRRMVECLGRDRTRHQVAEVTSLGLVQMTRKRIGTGLLESFSVDCDHCHGRGVVVHDIPVERRTSSEEGGGRGSNGGGNNNGNNNGGRGASGASGANGANTPASSAAGDGDGERRGRRRGGRGRGEDGPAPASQAASHKPSPAEFAAMAKAETPKDDDVDFENVESVEQPAVAEPVVPAEPQVVTRSRRGVSRTVTTSPAARVEVAAQPAASEPVAAAPAEPKVVTRSSRGVSRTVTTTTPVAPVEVAATVAEPVAVAPSAEPKVVTRASRGVSRTVTTTAPVAPVEVAAQPEAAEPVAATPSAEPKVVTRSSRGVSRTVTTTAPVAPVEVAAQAAAPAAAPETASEPPKVVTRTRGGSSRRTPKTPVAGPADQAGVEGSASPEGDDVEDAAQHVPIKRKSGPRKR